MMFSCPVPTTRTGKASSGFTLLEVLIAVVILALSFVAALKGFYLAQNAGIRAERLNTVSLLAQSKMEEVLNDPFAKDDGEFEDQPGVQWEVNRETVDLDLENTFTLIQLKVFWSDNSRDQMFLERLLPTEAGGNAK